MIKLIICTINLIAFCLGCGISLNNSLSTGSTTSSVNFHELIVLDPVRLDIPPKFKYFDLPPYPRLPQQAGIEGTVWIKGLVNTGGRLEQISVFSGSGTEALDEAAIQAANNCTFVPGIKDMKAVTVWIKYKVDFKLDY